MATIKSLIERIETRLFLAAGLDVQEHAEDQIVEMIRGTYNVLFDDFWDQNNTLFMSAELDGSTGQVTTDLTNIIRRYKDIHSVYWDQDERPLPKVNIGSNVGNIRTRSIMPSGAANSVFKMYPLTEVGPVHIWYRTKIADSVWEDNQYDTEINMDDEVLMLGVTYEFLLNDDSNAKATDEYRAKFTGRLKQMRDAQWNIPISKHKLEHDGPLSRWE